MNAKRLLLGPAVALPLILGFCSFHKPELPKVPEVTRQIPLDDFNQFPSPPQITTPKPVPHRKPVVKAKPNHGPLVLPPVPPAPPADVEREPDPPVQQYGRICIFPFGMIPRCTPGASE